jgi:hypothetical protein
MRKNRPELFRGRHFRDEVIVLCVRWYLRYPLNYRNLEEIMAERGLAGGSLHHRTLGSHLFAGSQQAHSIRDASSGSVVAR